MSGKSSNPVITWAGNGILATATGGKYREVILIVRESELNGDSAIFFLFGISETNIYLEG